MGGMPATATQKKSKRATKKTVKKTAKKAPASTAKASRVSPKARASSPGISDAAVLKATGQTTDQWFKILDARAEAIGKPDHMDLAAHLHEQHACPEWWAQMVTVLYEQARGHRVKGQTPSGFSVSGSRVVNVPITKLYKAWSGKQLAQWLSARPFTVRKATENRSIRITWHDDTNLEVMFYPKGDSKAQVTIQHGKLKSDAAATKVRAFWRESLDALVELLEDRA